MKLSDTCSCGSQFSAKGLPANVGEAYVLWLKQHATCGHATRRETG